FLGGARRLSARSQIAALIAEPTPEHRAAALALLAEQAAQGQNNGGVQILDLHGRLLLTTDSTLDAGAGDFPASIPLGDSGVVGKLRLVHDTLMYPIVVRTADKSGATLVQWRKMVNTAQSNRQAQQAIGAAMLVGNNDGS